MRLMWCTVDRDGSKSQLREEGEVCWCCVSFTPGGSVTYQDGGDDQRAVGERVCDVHPIAPGDLGDVEPP